MFQRLILADLQEVKLPYITPAERRLVDDAFDKTMAKHPTWGYSSYPLKDVPLNKLVATQEVVKGEEVENYKKAPSNKPPFVFLFKGKYYICDGHHRIHAALDQGKRSLPMHVMSYED